MLWLLFVSCYYKHLTKARLNVKQVLSLCLAYLFFFLPHYHYVIIGLKHARFSGSAYYCCWSDAVAMQIGIQTLLVFIQFINTLWQNRRSTSPILPAVSYDLTVQQIPFSYKFWAHWWAATWRGTQYGWQKLVPQKSAPLCAPCRHSGLEDQNAWSF